MNDSRTFDLCILDIDETLVNGKSVVRLWGIQNGKLSVVLDTDFGPYFYVEPKESTFGTKISSLRDRILEIRVDGRGPRDVDAVERKFLGKPGMFLKVTVDSSADIERFRDAIKEWQVVREEYEHNIPLYRRYMIDKGIMPMGWTRVTGRFAEKLPGVDSVFELESITPLAKSSYPDLRVLAFDIELAEESGEEKVIMVSLKDNAGFSRVLTYKKIKSKCVEVLADEKAMLERFVECVKERDPHVIVGYNTDAFDFPKLQERCAKNKVMLDLGRDGASVAFVRRGRGFAAQVRGRVHIDLYTYVENILSQTLTSEVLTLDRVAKEILGEGKKAMKVGDVQKAWETGRGLSGLADYCMNDSVLAMLLAEHLLPQIFEVCTVSGQAPFDVARMTYSQLVEWVLMRYAYHADEMVPNRPKYKEVMARRNAPPYAGGYVHEPTEGIHENIAVFDFRSLYPSIIVSHNISPETLDCACCRGKNAVPEGQHYYCTRHRGFIPGILNGIIKKRVETQERMKRAAHDSKEYGRLYNQQFAFKILSNAFYGYFGYPGSRWYSRVCAESITSWGRHYVKDVIRKAEGLGFEVVYGDTDSLFMKVSPKQKKNLGLFVGKVNNSLPGIMELEFKDLYKRGIFMEAKTGAVAKKKYALLDRKDNLIMRGLETRRRDWADIAKSTQEKVLLAVLRDASTQKAVNVVRETVQKLKSGRVGKEELVIYTQLTKRISAYEQVGPHVAVAKKMASRGEPVGEGSVISYIITKGPGSISEKAESAEDAKDYDAEYYIHHQVIPPALRILSGLGVKEEDLLKEQSSLEKFMKKK